MATEVILLETIQNLGELGDRVRVKSGFARNYLIPQNKAVRATEEAKARVEERRRELAKMEAERLDTAKAREALAVKAITVARRVAVAEAAPEPDLEMETEEGRLYGSVTVTDICEALAGLGTQVHRSEVMMPEGPIKHLGRYMVTIKLHPEVEYELTVQVVPEAD